MLRSAAAGVMAPGFDLRVSCFAGSEDELLRARPLLLCAACDSIKLATRPRLARLVRTY